jgi:hypothetical protein
MSILSYGCCSPYPYRAEHLSRPNHPLTPDCVVRSHEMLSKLFVALDLYCTSPLPVPPPDRASLVYIFPKFVWTFHVPVLLK